MLVQTRQALSGIQVANITEDASSTNSKGKNSSGRNISQPQMSGEGKKASVKPKSAEALNRKTEKVAKEVAKEVKTIAPTSIITAITSSTSTSGSKKKLRTLLLYIPVPQQISL